MSRRSRKVLLCGLLLLLCFILTLTVAACGEEDEPATLDPTTIGEYNKPGTVVMETIWTADVTIPEVNLDEEALINYFVGLYEQGLLPEDITDDELLDLMIEELVLNPGFYVYATPTDRFTSMETSGVGSGFIVTEDGYVVTNAHVVKASDEEVQQQLLLEASYEFLSEDLTLFEDYIGVDLSEEYEEYFLTAVVSIYDQYATVSKVDSETNMYMVNVDGELSDPYRCEVVEVGDPINMLEDTGKDIAVVKVNEDKLPTLSLGDDTEVRDGETAIALGYPAVATYDPGFDLTDIDPTLTQGTISAQKTMEGGWKVIQTDADISGGSSGGPLLNDQGEVIGVNTFSAAELNATTGEVEAQPGYNYAVPMTVAREFLDQANVEAELGPLSVKYREAIDLYEKEHYRDAKVLFDEVDAANSDFPYVDEYIENTTAKIDEGLDKSGSDFPGWLLILLIAAGAVIIVGLLLLFLFIMPQSRKKKAAAGEAETAIGTAAAAAPSAAPEPEPTPTPEAPAAEPAAVPTEEIPAPAAEEAQEAAPETPEAETTEPEEASKTEEGADKSFCSKCGTVLDPEDEFCSKCGTHKK